MESFSDYRKRKLEEFPGMFRAPSAQFREMYRTEYGEWPVEEESSTAPQEKTATQARNTHATLDTIASLISAAGWIAVCGGALVALFGLSATKSYGWLGLIYGVAGIVAGLLIVANGQFLKVVGQIEQNTQKATLLLERLNGRVSGKEE